MDPWKQLEPCKKRPILKEMGLVIPNLNKRLEEDPIQNQVEPIANRKKPLCLKKCSNACDEIKVWCSPTWVPSWVLVTLTPSELMKTSVSTVWLLFVFLSVNFVLILFNSLIRLLINRPVYWLQCLFCSAGDFDADQIIRLQPQQCDGEFIMEVSLSHYMSSWHF